MKLQLADEVISTAATPEDVARTVDRVPRSEDWYLILTSTDDDFMQASCARQNDAFDVEYAEQGQLYSAASPVDASGLKDLLTSYLHGDAEWRTKCEWKPGTKDDVAAGVAALWKAGGDSSKTIVWIVAGAVSLLVCLYLSRHLLAPHLPAPLNDPESWPVALVLLAIAGLLVFAAIWRTMWLRRPETWTETTARITKSAVAAKHEQHREGGHEVINVAEVEYEFLVDGRAVSGSRIRIEGDAAVDVEEALNRYTVGAQVPVFYNPTNPRECVLERGSAVNGLVAVIVLLAAICGGIPLAYFGMRALYHVLEVQLPNGHPQGVMFFAVGGLMLLMGAAGGRIMAKQAAQWDVTNGRIVSSGTESFKKTMNKRRVTLHQASVEYSYVVHGREYHGSNLDFSDDAGSEKEEAEQKAALYPVGLQVTVHYDPKNPSNAALEIEAGSPWFKVVLAVAFFALAFFFSGIRW